jgi:hypothetical protein
MESCHRLYGGGLSLVIALGSDLLNSQEQFLVIYLIAHNLFVSFLFSRRPCGSF